MPQGTTSTPHTILLFLREGRHWWIQIWLSLYLRGRVRRLPDLLAIKGADILADGRIAPRSGLASKNFIDTGAGVIDADYRGQVKVLLFNHAETEFKIKVGDRIAQLVLERVCFQTPKLPQHCAFRKLTSCI